MKYLIPPQYDGVRIGCTFDLISQKATQATRFFLAKTCSKDPKKTSEEEDRASTDSFSRKLSLKLRNFHEISHIPPI